MYTCKYTKLHKYVSTVVICTSAYGKSIYLHSYPRQGYESKEYIYLWEGHMQISNVFRSMHANINFKAVHMQFTGLYMQKKTQYRVKKHN